MKRTGLFDINNDELMEGDKVNLIITERQKKQNYYKFLEIDSMVAEVLDSDGGIGVSVIISSYSKGVKVDTTYESDLKYYMKHPTKDSDGNIITKESFEKTLAKDGKKTSDNKSGNIISSVKDCYSFSHSFRHIKKEIISKGVTGEARSRILSEDPVPGLVIKLYNGDVLSPQETYMITLSEDAKKFVLDQSVLLGDEDFMEGDITHLKATCKKISTWEHSFNFLGCNEAGECTYFEYFNDSEKMGKELTKLRVKLRDYTSDLESQGLDTQEVRSLTVKEWNKEKKIIDNSKEFMNKEEISNVFISLTSSVDVLNVLLKKGSTITPFNDPKKTLNEKKKRSNRSNKLN